MVVKRNTQNAKRKTKRRFGRIGVLMGGPSTEREISFKSGRAIFTTLRNAGLEAVSVDIVTDDKERNASLIKSHKIDCAFLALHGRFGEDGQIQQILEDLGVAYTCSGPSASRLAIDKAASRKIFHVHGLAVPQYREVQRQIYHRQWFRYNNLFSFPFVVKPATHGSSIGLSIVDSRKTLCAALDSAFKFDETAIIEEYISGREVTVGILNEQALPVIEIIPKKKFFDFEAKYQHGMTEYIVPAQLEENVAKDVQRAALLAHSSLGCYGCSRVDIILRSDNIPVILEVNTIPGFTETSLLPKAARNAGIDFTQLCIKLIELAYEKA